MVQTMREKDSEEQGEALRGCQKDIDFLSDAIEQLTDFPRYKDIYPYIAKTLKKITPKGTIILVNTFDPDKKTVTLQAFAGVGSRVPEIERILGRSLHGISFPVPDPTLVPMRTGECRELSGGIRELTFGALPEELYTIIEAIPLFGRVYGSGISWKGTLHGAVTFILPPGHELKNPRIVSIFVRQVAGYLQRRQADEDLIRSENLYRTIFENTGTATIIVREDTTIELVNRGFENLSGYVKEDVEGKLSWTEFVVKEDLERMKQYHIRRRQGSKFVPEIYEFRYTDRYGDVRNCINHIRMIPGTTKSIASILDITELKNAEEALTESEASYIGLFNTLADSVFILGRDGKLRNANRGAVQMFGYPLEFFIGKTLEALSAPGFNDLAQIHEHLTRASEGDFRMFGFQGRRSSGQDFPMEVRLYSGRYFGQEAVIAIAADITERKKAEAALQDSEKKYRELVENITDVVLTIDEHQVITYASPSLSTIFGVGPGQIAGLSIGEVFSMFAPSVLPPDLYDKVQTYWNQNRDQNLPKEVELNFIGPDKRVHVIEARATPVLRGDTFRGVQVIIRDVTTRRQAEDALRESEERYRSLVDNVTIGVFRATADASGTITWANSALVNILGYDSFDQLGKISVVDLYVNPADRVEFLEKLQKEGSIRNQELNLHRRDGSKIWIRETAYVTKNERGEAEYLAGIIEDVTERKAADEGLYESEKRFRELTDLLPQTVYEIDTSGRITFANRFAFEAFGYSREEFESGLQVAQMIHPGDRDRALQNIQRVMRGENVVGDGYQALRKDGTTFPVIIYGARIIRDNVVVGLRGIVADISEKKKA
jgi:PAS domain S-box-containing protein